MTIAESRSREILNWLDDRAGDHTTPFQEMTILRDAAALIRQLQAACSATWLDGLDEGRSQARHNDSIAAGESRPNAPFGWVKDTREDQDTKALELTTRPFVAQQWREAGYRVVKLYSLPQRSESNA